MRFVIRAILSVLLALVISRMFFESQEVYKVAGLAVALLGFAYLFEYTKKRDREGGIDNEAE
jgi:hypothetical protein